MRRVASVLFAVAALVVGCAPNTPPPPPGDAPVPKKIAPPFEGAAVLAPPDMTDDGPGSLVSVQPLTGSEDLGQADATYMRVVYRSTSGIDGSPTEVSGAVAIPPGKPPEGGWPILAFGQGTKGILNKCASSRFPTLPLNA